MVENQVLYQLTMGVREQCCCTRCFHVPQVYQPIFSTRGQKFSVPAELEIGYAAFMSLEGVFYLVTRGMPNFNPS